MCDSDAHFEAVSERDAEMDQFEVDSIIYQIECALWYFCTPPNTPFPRFGDRCLKSYVDAKPAPLLPTAPPNP